MVYAHQPRRRRDTNRLKAELSEHAGPTLDFEQHLALAIELGGEER